MSKKKYEIGDKIDLKEFGGDDLLALADALRGVWRTESALIYLVRKAVYETIIIGNPNLQGVEWVISHGDNTIEILPPKEKDEVSDE